MVLWLVGDGQVVSLLATVKFLKLNQWILSKLVYITKLILRAWTGSNTHKNIIKATTIAASPVYEVIPPLLRSLRDLLGASILSSFICSGRPQGESLHLTARSKFIIICSCSRLSWRLSSSLLDRKPPVEWPLAFLYQTRPKTHHHSFQVISSNLHDRKSDRKSGHSHCLWKKCAPPHIS